MWIPGFGKYKAAQGNKVGDQAPDFELADENGQTVRLRDLTGGKPVVLMFYLKAATPG